MKLGPKFKLAKRLGAPIFEKTQTQKFALSEARGGRMKKRRPGQKSDYSKQLTEKQKMRFSYGVSERQFRSYVNEAIGKQGHQPTAFLFARLESRLDNVVYRLGLAKTRQMARQMVVHGHVTVNGRKLSVPSHRVRIGDTIAVRDGSKEKGLFTTLTEDHTPAGVPNWLSFDVKKMTGEKKAEPVFEPAEALFDPQLVLEYYSR